MNTYCFLLLLHTDCGDEVVIDDSFFVSGIDLCSAYEKAEAKMAKEMKHLPVKLAWEIVESEDYSDGVHRL